MCKEGSTHLILQIQQRFNKIINTDESCEVMVTQPSSLTGLLTDRERAGVAVKEGGQIVTTVYLYWKSFVESWSLTF